MPRASNSRLIEVGISRHPQFTECWICQWSRSSIDASRASL
jgi:hypothetical protein